MNEFYKSVKKVNEFKVCDICKGSNVTSLIPKLKEIDNEANIDIGCQGFCGPGSKKPFVIVNNIAVIHETEDEVIDEVRRIIKGE